MKENAKKIIYQLALRTFTPEGTLAAATKLLGHVASLGVDIVYVCPFFVQECNEDREAWSERQRASETNNPKNPYKIADYFHVDEEYGTDEDLKLFVAEAHRLGLLVMFDLVYLHCGREAVFIAEHPDFVERNEDGSIKVPDRWPFARLNFASRELREYLMENMRVLVEEYGVDGFRCDVGDDVPLDFWEEAFSRLRAAHPSLITLNEGEKPQYIDETFDLSYAFAWRKLMRKIFGEGQSACDMVELYESECLKYGENIGKLIRSLDNHDTASDCNGKRNEIIMTSRGVEAALAVVNTYVGVPFVWNGYELCDDAENCMFSNRFYGKRSAMNWSKAFTADGVRRLDFMRRIHRLYHESEAIRRGALQFVTSDAPEALLAYLRTCGGERVLVAVNSKNYPVTAVLGEEFDVTEMLLCSDASLAGNTITLAPYGYLIARVRA